MKKSTLPKKRGVPQKYLDGLKEFYKAKGVGKGVKERHEFWKKHYNNPYISHMRTHSEFVRAFEHLWFYDTFPEDFTSC